MLIDDAAGLEAATLLSLLHAQCFPPGQHWSEAAMRDVLRMPGCFGWIEADPEPIGLALVRVAADESELLTLGILSGRRCQGRGERVLQVVCALAAERGAVRMLLEVAASNAAALSLYRRAGFTRAGLRRRYYPDGADALLLAAALPLAAVSGG